MPRPIHRGLVRFRRARRTPLRSGSGPTPRKRPQILSGQPEKTRLGSRRAAGKRANSWNRQNHLFHPFRPAHFRRNSKRNGRPRPGRDRLCRRSLQTQNHHQLRARPLRLLEARLSLPLPRRRRRWLPRILVPPRRPPTRGCDFRGVATSDKKTGGRGLRPTGAQGRVFSFVAYAKDCNEHSLRGAVRRCGHSSAIVRKRDGVEVQSRGGAGVLEPA